ncbi:hypothetical protein I79_025843 [Cricetulus griseus]|uniref:Uncharacterized protein n=1 Tax=Cricetulus griseus TaxID=10029 RepID=G3IPD6_CRIGR|nr:hypothetical protein I79_025843 [Cricetulus griseus]
MEKIQVCLSFLMLVFSETLLSSRQGSLLSHCLSSISWHWVTPHTSCCQHAGVWRPLDCRGQWLERERWSISCKQLSQREAHWEEPASLKPVQCGSLVPKSVVPATTPITQHSFSKCLVEGS